MTTPSDQAYREIPLSQGQVAIVDSDNFDWLNAHKWHAVWYPLGKCFYASRGVWNPATRQLRQVRMHRQILGLEAGDPREGEHCEPDKTLLNVRSNLRIATHSQNQMNRRKPSNNTSGFKGVSFHKASGQYRATIKVGREQKHLGYRTTAEAAYLELYVPAALSIHREFARLA